MNKQFLINHIPQGMPEQNSGRQMGWEQNQDKMITDPLLKLVGLISVLMLTMLLSACASMGPSNPFGLSELHEAVVLKDVKRTEKLLKQGADPNKLSRKGASSFSFAITKETNPMYKIMSRNQESYSTNGDDSRMINLLAKYGGNPNKYKKKTAPLGVAVQLGQENNVSALISAGAQVSKKDSFGYTPLHYAWKPGIVKLLLSNGADISTLSVAGQTPLDGYLEAKKKFEKVVARFEKKGVDNLDYKQGASYAMSKNKLNYIKQSIKVIQDPDVKLAKIEEIENPVKKGERLQHLVIQNNSGEYMCPWTSDGVLAEWVDKAINASMGASVGSAAGAYAGRKALENVPFLGSFLGSKVGEAAGRKAAIAAAGGEEYIKETSDLSFQSLEAMAKFIRANYADNSHYSEAVKAANEIYPGLQKAVVTASR